MRTLNALNKAKEALLYLCRRCDEQGFYSPPRQKLVEEALIKLTEEIDLLLKEGKIDIEPFEQIGCIHEDTLQMHREKTDDYTPTALWRSSKATYDEAYVPVYVLKNDLE